MLTKRGRSAFAIANYFLSESEELDGKRPLDLLRANHVEVVRLVAPEPPADLAGISLPLAVTATPWFRLVPRDFSSPLYWSREGRYRFGDEKAPKAHQAKLRVKKLGVLANWKSRWTFLDQIHVRVANLPSVPPRADWS